ncbi:MULTISPECIES: glutamine--fructose-6-phosphate transaminase (isomerizing) [Dehalobacter]|jgi:glucosamine--fructose-6-phosphate aminotransferase (isomerizing)|uniref:Glutamine--fructose-6-phosphate aminotransferase [isomerizing] n=2 Tax=Dehalobacter restrictus TaxID=55583 RepID=A0A857DKV0_9FIRM|nr:MULTISPECIES: glutamine--fructose-6-phosphate transaminase (isomerizing) [Dehalobacter]AHF10801.1 glutamine amidotransferase [Dehalobacter restrictus DSM 9455]MCG1026654.1 glutamine--fructose-6-phosphate transaminase (isomerizing) [Dehalobacter sp.]MDJ0306991.1 glutamine--fructose-6-phosphate transaminase (isomerizing) [Dehalobacter sp.]OCZ54221.1 glutamine--fructose-6-phosphate aminotransferase [Dehalobacter sp. TeCB1]QHA01433.1 glutamine--fructose-6-phosphate transaminase (isomerizing) [D
MCGIVGYFGEKSAVPILVEGLRKLEYRGYDSSGIAVMEEGGIRITKSVGKLVNLEEKLGNRTYNARIGIGHTRWATHGRPSDVNAHPHMDCHGDFAVVHNGIIENYLELREWLTAEGHLFRSETDTEVLAHLVEHFYKGDLQDAVKKMLAKVEGSYAVVVLSYKNPDVMVAARKDSPLIVGIGDGEYFVASDIPAVLKYTRKTYIMEDGEMVTVSAEGLKFSDFTTGECVEKSVFEVTWDAVAAEKGGYEHFMLKEIFEQPKALRDTLAGRLNHDHVVLQEVDLTPKEVALFNKVAIVACGTAYHAGLIGKGLIEHWAKIPVEVDIASEFRYRAPLIDDKTLVVVISQSGETADTLAALRESKKKGARVIAITNVVGSSVAREAHDVIHTWAGPEIAVASTKAYTTQIEGMILLALYLTQAKGTMPKEWITEIISELGKIPDKAEIILKEGAERIKTLARYFEEVGSAFFIGRGLDWAVAQEGSLKLKEISYIHAEAYASGELKHGTLALITEDTPIIALATQRDLYEKTVSNVIEVKARDAKVIGFTFEGNTDFHKSVNEIFYIPETVNELAPLLTVIPLQLLSYYVSVARGNDVDKPRNLAKSVTVE